MPPCTWRERNRRAQAAQRLGVVAGTRIFHTLIVHYENGVALQCEDRYVNPECAPDYLSVGFHPGDANALSARRGAVVGSALFRAGRVAGRAKPNCWAQTSDPASSSPAVPVTVAYRSPGATGTRRGTIRSKAFQAMSWRVVRLIAQHPGVAQWRWRDARAAGVAER